MKSPLTELTTRSTKAGARVDGNNTCSFLEISADSGVEPSFSGITASAEAKAHVLKVGDEDFNARFLGAGVGAKASWDIVSFLKDGRVLGVEANAKATLTECKAGPVSVHVGAGVTADAKVEVGTLGVKVAGCGIKAGKKIEVSVFDNEISIDTAALVGKGWLW